MLSAWSHCNIDLDSFLCYLALSWHGSGLIWIVSCLILTWKWPYPNTDPVSGFRYLAFSWFETSRQLSYLYVQVTFFMRCTGQPQKLPALTYMWKLPYNTMDLAHIFIVSDPILTCPWQQCKVPGLIVMCKLPYSDMDPQICLTAGSAKF